MLYSWQITGVQLHNLQSMLFTQVLSSCKGQILIHFCFGILIMTKVVEWQYYYQATDFHGNDNHK